MTDNLPTDAERAVAALSAEFQELLDAGLPLPLVVDALVQVALGAMVQLEGQERVGMMLKIMGDKMISDAAEATAARERGAVN